MNPFNIIGWEIYSLGGLVFIFHHVMMFLRFLWGIIANQPEPSQHQHYQGVGRSCWDSSGNNLYMTTAMFPGPRNSYDQVISKSLLLEIFYWPFLTFHRESILWRWDQPPDLSRLPDSESGVGVLEVLSSSGRESESEVKLVEQEGFTLR